MGTSNFASLYNADSHYAVLMDAQDHWEYDDFKQHLCDVFQERFENSEIIDKSYGNNRSYHCQELCSVTNSKCYGDIWVEIKYSIVITSGYYQGCNIDYLVQLHNGCQYETNLIQESHGWNHYPMSKAIEDHFEVDYDDHCDSELNKGMRTILSKHALKWAEEDVEKMRKPLNDFLRSFCEHELVKTAQFSNGEAIYESVKS